jgi:putative transposase
MLLVLLARTVQY